MLRHCCFKIFQVGLKGLVLVLLWVGCGTPGYQTIVPAYKEDFDMKAELKRLAETQPTITSIIPNDPVNDLADFKPVPTAKLKTKDLEDRINYAFLQIILGNLQNAIELLTPLEQDPPKDKDYQFMVYHMLGLAYQRLGEVVNCANHHTNESCILPISAKGAHVEEMGSTKAIAYYQKCLEIYPEESLTRWLITICNQTLAGKYTDTLGKILVDLTVFDKPYPNGAFKDISADLGISDFGYLGGIVIEDFNNDGMLDIFVTSYMLDDNVKLYQNTGTGFEDVTDKAGLTGITGGVNVVQADYNNDGFADIFVMRGGWLEERGLHPQSLLRNNGDMTFTDVTQAAGILTYQACQTASWADVDNDGWLDLFVANENFKEDNKNNNLFSQLYRNNGDGTFTNISQQAGIIVNRYVKGSVFTDVNNDGWPDLYLSIYKGLNLLFINTTDTTGKVSFQENALNAGVSAPFYSFPVSAFDVNNDGWEDLLVMGYQLDVLPDMATEYARKGTVSEIVSRLYINNGNGTFRDESLSAGLYRSIYAMGLNIGDIDNDGFTDVYAATGLSDYRGLYPNLMLRNAGGERFEDVTTATRTGHLQKGHACAFGDLNNDGSLDLFVVMGGVLPDDRFFNCLFENPGTTNNWLRVKLIGTKGNRSAIGARIKLILHEPTGYRYVYKTIGHGGSYGANPLEQFIGVGAVDKILRMEITWPTSKTTQVFAHVPVNMGIVIKELDDTYRRHSYTPLSLAPLAIPTPHIHEHEHNHKQEKEHMHNGHQH